MQMIQQGEQQVNEMWRISGRDRNPADHQTVLLPFFDGYHWQPKGFSICTMIPVLLFFKN